MFCKISKSLCYIDISKKFINGDKLNFSDNIICSTKSFIDENDIISIISNHILINIKIFFVTQIRVCFIEKMNLNCIIPFNF